MKQFLYFFLLLLFTPNLFSATSNDTLILYQNNQALVHETQPLHVVAGEKKIIYNNVAQNIDINSLHVTMPKNIHVTAQHYYNTPLTHTELLRSYLHQKVRLYTKDSKKFQTLTLLSFKGSQALVQDRHGAVFAVDASRIGFDRLPYAMQMQPYISWDVDVKKNTDATLSLDYLLHNISFTCNYILKLKDDTSASLDAWVSIQNNSAKSFHNVSLAFVAGKVHTTPPAVHRVNVRRAKTAYDAVQSASFQGYHLYTLGTHINLPDNTQTQFKLFSKRDIAVTRTYSLNAHNPLYLYDTKKQNVRQSIQFNSQETPMPQGRALVYADTKKFTLLVGADTIANTPKNTPVVLQLGEDFDLYVEQIPLMREETKRHLKATVRYTLHNTSEEQKTLKLNIPFHKSTKSKIITSRNYSFTKGNFATFTCTLEPESTQTFTVTFER